MILNPYIFNKTQPNTFIGGIGATINTPALLATKLGISQSIIKSFKVVGTEVQAYISDDYTIKINTFNEDEDITHYRDMDGRVTSLTLCFRNAINLIDVYFPNVQTIQGANASQISSGCFSGCVNLEEAVFNNWQNTGDYQGYFTFYNCVKLTGLDTSKLTGSPSNQFLANTTQTSFDFSSLVTISGNMFLNSSVAGVLSLPEVTSMPQTGITNCAVTQILLPKLEGLSGTNKTNLFVNLTQLELLDAKKLKNILNPAIRGTNAFNNLKTNCIINVHEYLATANSGSPDEALVWVKANRSAVVNFYDDNGDYVSTL